jgi:hypothetical protein
MNNRYTLGVIAALAFAGCGSQVAPTGGAPQSATPAKHGKSWMLPEAATGDSLYVTTLAGVKSYSYPRGKHIGTLKMFTYDNSGICPDKAGDVFIDYGKLLLEYKHGGKKPIGSLTQSGYYAYDCASDTV